MLATGIDATAALLVAVPVSGSRTADEARARSDFFLATLPAAADEAGGPRRRTRRPPRKTMTAPRVIVRRERPHPGAQLSFTDHDGHRSQAILTDQPDPDIATLERLHRARARVEDRIRAAKDCGLANLPFGDFDANAVWLELVLLAQDLLYMTQTLALTGELARCEPKRLRYRLLHTAGRLAFHARQAVLRLPRTWPWAGELAAAFARLAALPAR